MEENSEKVVRFVLQKPVLVGLSERYYIIFFLTVPISLLVFMALSLLTNRPALAVSAGAILQVTVYLVLLVRRKKYGDTPNEVVAYKKQDKEILFDDTAVFENQEINE